VGRRRTWLTAGLVLPLLLACAGAPAPREPTVLEGSAARDLLILPLNVTVAMPKQLDAESSVVWEELEIYLQDQGKQLKTAAFGDARRLWVDSIREVRSGEKGAKAGFDDAARVLVGKLARYAEFDTVIVPSLFVRQAPILEKSARWDGVERDVEVEAVDLAIREAVEDVPLEGAAPAASLHAVVLDARGNKLQEGQGGLELLVRVRAVRAEEGSDTPTFQFVERRPVFTSRAHVREGIARALSPFLPPLLPDER
jgi:hypothetical protein